MTLLQTSKISKKEMVLVLYGGDYWRDLIKFDSMVKKGAICADDLDLFRIVSTPREAFSYLKKRLTARQEKASRQRWLAPECAKEP